MFQQLRRLQELTHKHFPCLQSHIDSALIVEIGYYQEQLGARYDNMTATPA